MITHIPHTCMCELFFYVNNSYGTEKWNVNVIRRKFASYLWTTFFKILTKKNNTKKCVSFIQLYPHCLNNSISYFRFSTGKKEKQFSFPSPKKHFFLPPFGKKKTQHISIGPCSPPEQVKMPQILRRLPLFRSEDIFA